MVLGASKGLGASVVEELAKHHPYLLIVGRNEIRLNSCAAKLAKADVQTDIVACDVFKSEDQKRLFEMIEDFKPDRIINLIGGGPFGRFSEKEWKDHAWAFEVTFLFSARLLHFALGSEKLQSLKQIVFTGSSVAENKADPNASSYSAAKHALRGLVYSVNAESPGVDLRLYSPPYMDTNLLPKNAWPRESGQVCDPTVVAQHMVRWIFEPPSGKFHNTYNGE